MNTNNRANYLSGFVPFALAVFLVGIIGGFTTVLGPAFVKNLNLDYNNTTWTALAMAISTVTDAPILENFTISSDFVTNKLEERRSRSWSFPMPRPYTLVFSRGSKYRIPGIKNYKWSNMFDMQNINVFHCSNLNDDFYLISIGKRRNIVAYNKKMFEYIIT